VVIHDNKVAVVTGAAGGLGKDFAKGLAQEGATIVGITRKTPMDDTKAAVEAVGGKILCLKGDCSNPADVERMAKEILDKFGRVDILVNNAAIYPVSTFEDMDFAFFNRVRNTNMDSVFLMIKAFIGGMKKNGWGRIINIVSNSVQMGMIVGQSAYMSSKMGIIGLSRGLANEYGDFGVTINCLGPNATRTPGMGEMEENMPGLFEAIASMGSIKRLTTSDDYIGMLNLLASDAGSFLTGQTYYIDGGLSR